MPSSLPRIALGVTLVLALGSCSGRDAPPEPEAPPQSTVETSTPSAARLVGLQWEAEPEAKVYHVQAWDGDRLLFEEERTGSSLDFDASMLRALREARSAEFVIVVEGADGVRRRAASRPTTRLGDGVRSDQ